MVTTPDQPDLETRSSTGEEGIEEKCFSVRACIKKHAPEAFTGYGILAAMMLCPPVALICLGYGIKCGAKRVYRAAHDYLYA